jgi:hypothetical protein
MSDWITLQQDLERFHARAGKTQDVSGDELWDMYQESLFLREMVYEHVANVPQEELVKATQLLVEADHLLQEAILAYAASCRHEVREWLEQRAKEYDNKIRALSSDVGRPLPLVVAELQGFSCDLAFLKRLASFVEHKTTPSSLPDTLSQIHATVVQAAEAKELFSDPLLSQKLAQLRTDALDKEVNSFTAEVQRATAPEAKNIEQIWQTLCWGTAIEPHMSRRNAAHRPLQKLCQQNREELRKVVSDHLAKLSPQARYELLEKLAWDTCDRANEVLSQIAETSLSSAIKNLTSMREDTLWLNRLMGQYSKASDTPSKLLTRCRKLRKADKYVRAELQEKMLQERLENIFGTRFVAWFETTILMLIFVAVLLLLIEHHSPSHWHKPLLLADTAICGIFLLEFFIKISLAKGKLLYLWRHWFIDLLPSLPFGIFLYHAEALETIHHFDYSPTARLIRLLRLSRLLRYIRILRPLIRIFRIVSFMLRGMDRMVRRYAKWCNRNIIFFSNTTELAKCREPGIYQQFQNLYGKSLMRGRTLLRRLSCREARPLMLVYLESLDVSIRQSHIGTIMREPPKLELDVMAEDVVESLINMNGAKIEEIMGSDFPVRLHRYFGFFDIPLIRHLPGINTVVKKQRKYSPPQFSAWLGRCLGRLLEKIMALIYWGADMYGVVTGPRLIDRLGSTLKNSFQRPAQQLLIMGGIFLILNFMITALPEEVLPLVHKVMDILERYIGLPMIIVGVSCLLPLLFGIWLQHLGGEATEFYQNTAEAQFITLLKEIKLFNFKTDMQILYNRVLRPEVEISSFQRQQDEAATMDGSLMLRWMQLALTGWAGGQETSQPKVTTHAHARSWKLQRQVTLLYKDYLDGALLHKSDIKTTKQLLGNLMLGNILRHKLGYTRKDMRRLEKLDLSRNRAIFGGPYLWFNLITQSVLHNTAQLIVEYNKHAIPEVMIPLQPKELVDAYRQWLDKRLSHKADTVAEASPQVGRKLRKNAVPLYSTTQFTALHFLSAQKAQDEAICLNFEEPLYRAFVQDRKHMIREIFGSYPLHDLPRTQRTLNLFYVYQEYVAAGRIFLLPLHLIGWSWKLCRFIVKWVWQKIGEILHPMENRQPLQPSNDFQVIVRKINRMRKPVFIECMKIRARFDFEYLGLHLPGTPGLALGSFALPGSQSRPACGNYDYPYQHDLHFIQALDDEWEYFHDLRHKHHQQLQIFHDFLHHRCWDGDRFAEYLEEISHELVIRKNEIVRALAIAFTIDYRCLSSLVRSQEIVRQMFDEAVSRHGRVQGYAWYKPLWARCKRLFSSMFFLRRNWEKKTLEKLWQTMGYSRQYGAHELAWCWKGYLTRRRTLYQEFSFIHTEGDAEVVEEIVQNIIRNPSPWKEELVAIRTIQTLSVLDVQNYRQHVAELGEYQQKGKA